MVHKKDTEAFRGNQLDRFQWENQRDKLNFQDGEFGVEITPEDLGIAQMRQLIKSTEKSHQH